MTRPQAVGVLRQAAIGFVLRECGITYRELTGKRRHSELVAARALFVWIVRTYGADRPSFPTIGTWLGGRDHTTILHLWHVVAPRLRNHDPKFRQLCDRFDEQKDVDQVALLRAEAQRTIDALNSIISNLEAVTCP